MNSAGSLDKNTLSTMGQKGAERAKARHWVDTEAKKLASAFFGESDA